MSLLLSEVKEEDLTGGYDDTAACTPQASEIAMHTTASTSGACSGQSGNHPAYDGQPLAPAAADRDRVAAAPCAFGSPAWYFFGVPGGSSNLQRELVVTCVLCRAQVRRGTNPGKVGTTCLFTHLERRHNMTRQEVYEQAAASGYCGTSTTAALSWECGGGGNLSSRVPAKRHGASTSSEDGEGGHRPKHQVMTVPAIASGPTITSGPSSQSYDPSYREQSDRHSQSGSRSSTYRQALRDRLLGSVHMFCEVCHALVLSGERSQNVRDLALETHFSSKHPHMFNRLKRGAARDVRIGGLGPLSALPSGSLSPSSAPH